MRIAQIAPLYESVPPRLYGGTERVVSYLTEELVAMGHEVTLFASGDSLTTAELVAGTAHALRLDGSHPDPVAAHFVLLAQALRRADQFEVMHFHTDYLHFPLATTLRTGHLTTIHGRLDLPHLEPLYAEYRDLPLVSISERQRLPIPDANWLGVVHHGLPIDLHQPGQGDGGYLAFLGRISPEKRPDRAIAIARRVGMPLRIAAKVSDLDRPYFEREIEPLLDDPLIEFIGEIGEHEKDAFLGEAHAVLFPIDWEEPFGLVMIEAMACGTPVVAFRAGSVPEVIEDGVSGFLVDSVDEAVEAVRRVRNLSRDRCREEFERRFTSRRMAEDYVHLYERLRMGSGSLLDASSGRYARPA